MSALLDCWPSLIWASDILNNQSLAAFLGACAAFLLVVLTDDRRRRRTVRLIRSIVLLEKLHAEKKLEQVNRNIDRLKRLNKVQAAPFMPFNPGRIEQLQLQVLDLLSEKQSISLDAILYWMGAINGLLNKALSTAETLVLMVQNDESTAARERTASQLMTTLEEAAANIRTFIFMAEKYSSGEFEKIVNLERPALE